MPFVPMPGAMPRSYSFRRNSERTLGQKSMDQPSQLPSPVSHNEMESVAELPSESEPYDTPYRTDFQQSVQVQLPTQKHKTRKTLSIQEESVYEEEGSEVDASEYLPTAEASYIPEAQISTISSNSHSESYTSHQPTIALFGGSGVTGGHFLTAALDAGYNVRCIPADDPREMGDHAHWGAIQLALEDAEQIKAVVYQVDYVVIMLNDVIPGKNDYPSSFMTCFIKRLYNILREESTVQVVLFQANSLASDIKGRVPILSKVIKTVAKRRNSFLQDQDAAIHQIGVEHGLRKCDDENQSVNLEPPHFDFIITRPSVLLQDGPSSRKLSASKSQPGPFPVTNIDLADFSLRALTMKRMYNSSPYVVADSF